MTPTTPGPDWVAIGAAAFAGVSAAVAVWEAFQARGSRRRALKAEEGAAEQARLSLQAQTSIAAAIEALNPKRLPWEVTPMNMPGAWLVKNDGGRRLEQVTGRISDEHGQRSGGATVGPWIMDIPSDWPNGRSERVTLAQDARLSLARRRVLILRWREVGDDPDAPFIEEPYDIT